MNGDLALVSTLKPRRGVFDDGGGFGGPKVGRHAYSRTADGKGWIFNSETLTYNTTVEFEDGKKLVYNRRERPQLFFSDDGTMTPLYLVNGVQEKNSGQSYTLIVPLRTAARYEEERIEKLVREQKE